MWQNWSVPHTLLTWLKVIFTCSLNWNQHWRDGTFVVLLISLIIRRQSCKAYQRMTYRNVSNTLTVAGSRSCTRGPFWNKCGLNCCSALYFSEIKIFSGTCWSYHVLKLYLDRSFSVVIRQNSGRSRNRVCITGRWKRHFVSAQGLNPNRLLVRWHRQLFLWE